MKTPIDKEKLTYLNAEEYKTQNPNIRTAVITRYLYDRDGIRYQPQIRNIEGEIVTDRCCYAQKEEAQKAIDSYAL